MMMTTMMMIKVGLSQVFLRETYIIDVEIFYNVSIMYPIKRQLQGFIVSIII